MLKLLLGIFVLIPMLLSAWDKDILISTPNTSLLLSAPQGEELKFIYYGDKIDASAIPTIYDAGLAINKPAYPVFGTESVYEPSIIVQHADGNMTLDMKVVGVETEAADDYELVKVMMQDKVYPFNIDVFYKAFKNSDIIETWTELSHKEKKPVKLQKFSSAYMPIRQGDVWISHLHGAWANESKLVTEPLTRGMKVLKNKLTTNLKLIFAMYSPS